MTENNQSTAESGISTLFGYYPERVDITTTQFTMQTHSDFRNAISLVGGDPHVVKDWIYPGAQRTKDLLTGQIYEMPYRARVFGLPKTHQLTLHGNQKPDDLEFVVWCLSFFTGMRLTTTKAGFLDATPVKPGKLVDFILVGCNLSDAVQLALEYLAAEAADPRAPKRVSAVIHALFLAQFPQSLPFERFQYLYMALDACFKLVACKQVKTPSVPHGRRIEWICTTLGLPVPSWADSAMGAADLATVRNDAIHEALFFDEPLGFAIYGGNTPGLDTGTIMHQMQALVCRLLMAILGKPKIGYVLSPVDTRQVQVLELHK
jgi:hypothetical protein